MTELIDQNKGKITAETVQKIQTDHKDVRAQRFIEILQLAANKANLLQALSPKAQGLLLKLFDWARNGSVADRNLVEPLLYEVWMKNLSELFFAQLAKGQDPTVVAAFSKGTIGTKTLYHKVADLMNGAPESVMPLLVGSLEKAAAESESSYAPGTRWGQVNRVAFTSAIDVVLPAPPSVPLERDGSADTVDVAGAGFGPNFRLIIVLKENAPTRAYNVVPGGNWGPFDSKAMVKELLRWRDGQKRELVPFL